MHYSFWNSGTVYFFKPGKPAYDIRDGVKRTALEFHTKLVVEADRTDVFIKDDRGNIIVQNMDPVTNKPRATRTPMAEWKRMERTRWSKFKEELRKSQ
jgi:hypothetical protein